MKRQTVIGILVILLSAAGLYFLLSKPSPPANLPEQIASPDAGAPGVSRLQAGPRRPIEPDSGDVQEILRPGSFKAESFADMLQQDPEIYAESEQQFEQRVARVRAGSREDARKLINRLYSCRVILRNRVFKTLVQHRNIVKAAESQRQLYGDKSWEERSKQHFIDELENLQREIPSCLPYIKNYNQTLRNSLEQWADNGNVAARAVYASWPPYKDLDYTSLEALRYWESRSLEFTLENLAAGEPLAFILLIRTYSYALFTPYSLVISRDFYLTAIRCGYTEIHIEYPRLRQSFGSRYQNESAPSMIALFIERSEKLRHYCRSGEWWDAEQVQAFFAKEDL